MTVSLTRREVDDLRSNLDRAIYKCLGYSDSSVLSTASSCLINGYDRRKIADRLSSHVDSKKASRLAEKILKLAEDVVFSGSKKRSHDSSSDLRDRDSKKSKTSESKYSSSKDYRHETSNGSSGQRRTDEKSKLSMKDITPDMATLLVNDDTIGAKITGLSADRIKLMMANAQKEIEERKRALHVIKSDGTVHETRPHQGQHGVNPALAMANHVKHQIQHTLPPPGLVKPSGMMFSVAQHSRSVDEDNQRKIAELQARIQSKLASGALAASISHPAPLILDREGRTVDRTGREVTLTQVVPTLKANIRAKRREEFRHQLSGTASVIPFSATPSSSGTSQQEDESLSFVDPRVTQKPAARNKRALRFHEPGKFQQMAERLRMKAQLEKLQNEISQIAKKTGISSVTKLALMAPDTQDDEHVPELEWWDSVIMIAPEERKPLAADSDIISWMKEEAITNLVEHPTQLRPATDQLKPVYMPVFLTKKETKKLRRQNRRETWKEEQEKVRLGLEAPAEPKLRISNLMRALGTEAVAEPSKIEAHVREQMAKRQRAHLEHNAERKLTPEQKKEKLARRIKEDTSSGVNVTVYRIKDLFNSASNKFKVETNAKQLYMTGCVVLHKDCCVVVVEGGPKQNAKYKRLMLHRIKWDDGSQTDPNNSCRLVWEGTVPHRSFGEIRFKACPTEKMAREHFRQHSVPHYWDLAFSGSLLDNEDQTA